MHAASQPATWLGTQTSQAGQPSGCVCCPRSQSVAALASPPRHPPGGSGLAAPGHCYMYAYLCAVCVFLILVMSAAAPESPETSEITRWKAEHHDRPESTVRTRPEARARAHQGREGGPYPLILFPPCIPSSLKPQPPFIPPLRLYNEACNVSVVVR